MSDQPKRFAGVSQSGLRKAARASARGWTADCAAGPAKFLRTLRRKVRGPVVTPGFRGWGRIEGMEATR